jgi:hypothetical protein
MTTRKKHRGNKKQKVYNMKGCSKTYKRKHTLGRHKRLRRGGSNDPIAPLAHPYNGGSCPLTGECGSCPLKGGCGSCSLKGGSFYKTDLPPVPAPLVGKPWLPFVVGWPGVDGVDSGRNYLANNLYKNDPQTMMKLDGGSIKNKQSRKNKSRKVRGGGLMPQEFVNLGRDLSFNLKSSFNSLNGYQAPVNPKPYMDQFPNSLTINKLV